MGMYTVIWNADRTKSWQIKTGWDDLDEYRIGDAVAWRIDKAYPGRGSLLDGIYSGIGERGTAGWAWVIIKDHRVAHIEPYPDTVDDYEADFTDAYDALVAQWQPVPYLREWWSEEAWAKHEAEELERKKRYEALREKHRCRRKHKHTMLCHLKEMFPPEPIREVMYAEAPFFKMLAKKGKR